LSAAVKALREAGLTKVPVFGLAKRNEELYKPGRARPIIIERDSPTLFLVQRVRDEATDLRSPTTAGRRDVRRCVRSSTSCPAWARCAGGRCSVISAASTPSAMRRSSN